jgi:hypothetical protein
MSSFRVAPDAHSTRALGVVSNWTARYARGNHGGPKETSTPAKLIEQAVTRRIDAREKIFEKHLPFSWLRFFIGVVSLVLVFSDTFRSGLGVTSLSTVYPVLQPDEVVNFGTSWNHSVFHATKSEASNSSTTARVWSYKFDSTSISWRAFASHLAVSEFPACFFYHEACPSTTISGEVAFNMIDALVDAVANVKSGHIGDTEPVSLSMRTQSEYVDRFHQLLLPQWFTNVNWRTNQALHYCSEALGKTNARTLCFPTGGDRVSTPRFCQQLWVNYQRSCAPADTAGKSVGLLYVHILDRVRIVQSRFPDLAVDLTILESQDDLQVSRGGFSALGFRWTDVSTIIRARYCNDGSCETVYVDDYRYETGLLVSDIVEWYRVVASLRIIGQSYFFLRGIGLVLSCYYVYKIPKLQSDMSTWTRVRKAGHLFMKAPTQCVVYGSPFPVLCYVLAHLFDAPFTYQVLDSHLLSLDGVINMTPQAFISYAVVQMRNVWIYALALHLVVSASKSRWMNRSNQISSGIIGVPEFLLSGFSSITLSAQYRSTSFRSTKVLAIMILPSNVSRAWETAKYRYSFGYRGRGNTFLGGVIIDVKYFICLAIGVAMMWTARTAWLHYRAWKTGEDKFKYSQWVFLSPTPVPYSAGALWPTVSMCVHWTSDFFCVYSPERNQTQVHLTLTKLQKRSRWRKRVLPFATISIPTKELVVEGLRSHLHKYKDIPSTVRMSVDTFRYIQHQMKCLHGRSDNVEANVAFMNAVLMSDPLVYIRMMLGRYHSTELAYYQSTMRPQQILLLPIVIVGEHNEYSHGLRLLKRVNACDLRWPELVQCG